MQVYARRNPVMIQQPETSSVVESESLEKQNMCKKRQRRAQRMAIFWTFSSRKILEKIKTAPTFVSLLLDHMSFETQSDTGAVYPT